MLVLFQASDILVYFLTPLYNFMADSFSCIIFQTFFYAGVALMAMIGVVTLIRNIAFEQLRREVF